MTVNPQHLTLEYGTEGFTPEQFAEIIASYMPALQRVGRTNWLCVFEYGDGVSPRDVTGYRTNQTIHATINDVVLKSERTGGRWAVYRYTPVES